MPYKLNKNGSGYKVTSPNHPSGFSKKPLSKNKAKKQLAAIQMNTNESFEQKLNRVLNELFNNSNSIEQSAYNSLAMMGSNLDTYLSQMNELIKNAAGTPQEKFLRQMLQIGISYADKLWQEQLPKNGPRGGVNDPDWKRFASIRNNYMTNAYEVWKQLSSTVSQSHSAYWRAKNSNTLRQNETGDDVLRREG